MKEKYLPNDADVEYKVNFSNIYTNIRYEIFSDYLIQIEQIQKSDKFISQVKESQLRNPEYWSPEYVLITNLKSYFVNFAINSQELTLSHSFL